MVNFSGTSLGLVEGKLTSDDLQAGQGKQGACKEEGNASEENHFFLGEFV